MRNSVSGRTAESRPSFGTRVAVIDRLLGREISRAAALMQTPQRLNQKRGSARSYFLPSRVASRFRIPRPASWAPFFFAGDLSV